MPWLAAALGIGGAGAAGAGAGTAAGIGAGAGGVASMVPASMAAGAGTAGAALPAAAGTGAGLATMQAAELGTPMVGAGAGPIGSTTGGTAIMGTPGASAATMQGATMPSVGSGGMFSADNIMKAMQANQMVGNPVGQMFGGSEKKPLAQPPPIMPAGPGMQRTPLPGAVPSRRPMPSPAWLAQLGSMGLS